MNVSEEVAAEREEAYARAGVAAPPLRPATDAEKSLLRSSIVRKATQEEADAFLLQNARFLSTKAENAFRDMSDEDKFRVISEGPMTECMDSTEILYGRVKRFMDMEAKLRSMANSDPREEKKIKEKTISSVALSIAQTMAAPKFEEVPVNERKTGVAAGTVPVIETPKVAEKVLIGTRQGVGGVIESLQKKYNMQKGERAKVVAETKELWKVEGDRNVPKTHRNVGWKWCLVGEEAEAKKKAEAQARKQQEKAEAETRKAEGAKKVELEKRKAEDSKRKKSESSKQAKKSKKDDKKDKIKQKRRRAQSSGSSTKSSPSSPPVKRKAKFSKKARSSSEDPSSEDSRSARRKTKRKASTTSSSDCAHRRKKK